ncbi:MAG TPA: PAN domain-containing protein [Saprospiraceae bacterium]|nr:PAN domain-containing protein [Saprospiraceae bacterium]
MKNMIQTLRGVKISFQQPVHFFIKTTWLLLLMWLITIPNLSKAQITYGVFDPEKGSLSKVENQNLPGGDYKRIELTSVQTCQVCIDSCLNDPKCAAYTYVKPGVQSQNGVCWLKSSVPTPVTDPNCISGIKTIIDNKSEPNISYHENIDIPGNNLRYIDLKPGETCQTCIDACLNDINCIAYTYTKPGFQAPNGRCYLKTAANQLVENKNCISGIKVFKLNYATGINKLTLPRPSDATSFYAGASTYLLAMQLSQGQTLWDKGTDSKDYNFHHNWAKQVSGNKLWDELAFKFNTMVDLKNKEGASALANYYALVCETWANYGLDFGSASANSKEATFHKNWAMNQPVSELKFQINLRLEKIFASYNITPLPVNPTGKTGSVAARCETYLKIPGLVIGMSDFAKDGSKFTPPDYLNLKKFMIDDTEASSIEPNSYYHLYLYKVPSLDTDDPYIWSLPPGIVVGLAYSYSFNLENDKVFGYKPFKGPESLGGGKFKKQNGGDLGAPEGIGWYWYESTGLGFSDWSMIECLPRGTVVGLKHSINQKGKQFVWQGINYDATNPAISPPQGFLRRHYGDMGTYINEGYYWYEKITDPPSK